ncbi:MAG TPA: homocysteine S-methyltransferase family protein [bacterium]|nr:homocysteine S-methyltransferase family protein [bacterium]
MKLRREQFKALARKRVLLLDGAMGTLLQDKGLPAGEPPDGFNLYNPDAVRAAHAAYVAAGADIILTNTFGATKRRLAPFRLASRADEINRAGVALAREAAGDKVRVAGDVGPLGEYPEPLGALSFDEAYREFYRQARVLADAGVDLVVVETMSDLREAKAAVVAARAAFDGPIIAFMTFDEDGRAVTGTPPEVAAVTLVAAGADAVGANCSVGARELVPVIRAMAAAVDVPVCAEPNAGLPRLVAGKTAFRQTPAQFASWVPKLVAAGAAVVGGCCGTTPEHVRLAAKAAEGLTPPRRSRGERRSTLAARARLVVVGGGAPVVVGERINPTGRRELTREFARNRFDLAAREAEAQVAAGAAVVDVNVGDGEGAAGTMAAAVRAVQDAVDVPASVDSARPEVLEAGLKAAVGKPLLNSCPASARAMARLLPMARRWGAAVVGLAMGARGIPATAASRLKLAEKFVGRALDEGIALDDIYVDPLMLTAARGGAAQTFETLREIKENLGVRTVMGVSNVSHGLPERDVLNAAAFLYAAGAGLDLAIVNPLDERMRQAMRTASALAGGEREVASYVEAFSRKAPRKKERKRKATPGGELYEAVLGGRRERAKAAAARALKNSPKPLVINDKFIAPALKEVGRLFERKEYYLPQVIRAAEAAQAAFGVVEKAIDKKSRRPAGRVVFATVAGDVHDIGKNVVAAVLRSHGFDVYDLGKNVSTPRVVESAAARRADVVALSALMTTTMPEMGKVAEALRARGVKARLLVGGAVVTKKYADEIGAAYARDAVAAARVAKRLVRP